MELTLEKSDFAAFVAGSAVGSPMVIGAPSQDQGPAGIQQELGDADCFFQQFCWFMPA